MWINNNDTLRLTKGISTNATSDFLDMWNTDLEVLKDYDTKQDAIEVANGYLRYFGSVYYVADIDWDRKSGALVWNMKEYVKR